AGDGTAAAVCAALLALMAFPGIRPPRTFNSLLPNQMPGFGSFASISARPRYVRLAPAPSHRRRTVGMKRLDRLQPPRLALLALLLGPHDRLPVRREDETGAGVGDLDAVAAGFIDVEEEGLL